MAVRSLLRDAADLSVSDRSVWRDSTIVVAHGSDATVSRPKTSRVEWVGSVMPDYGAEGDVWRMQRPHLSEDQLWDFDGTVWVRRSDYEIGYPGPEMRLEFTTIVNSTTVGIPLNTSVNVVIDWGDGSSLQTVTSNNPTHVYSEPGKYTVVVSGAAGGMGFNGDYPNFYLYLTRWWSLGRLGITNFLCILRAVREIPVHADAWDTSAVTNMGLALFGAPCNPKIGSWDTSSVTNMGSMFRGAGFNQYIGEWDTSSVTDMSVMFMDNSRFNQDISGWNTSSVTSMSNMFLRTARFQTPIGSWDVSNVTNMNQMLSSIAWNQPLNDWDVSSVTNFGGLFTNSTSFNQPLDAWDVSSATALNQVFQNARAFQQPLNTWNFTGSVNLTSFMVSKTGIYSYATNYYDDLLVRWDELVTAGTLAADRSVNMGEAKYTAAGAGGTARANLVSAGWAIVDGGAV
jgi:surface protein